MEGAKGAKGNQKKAKATPEESSGEDGVLQIDVEVKKGGSSKKQTDGAKPKKKGSGGAVAPAVWGIGDLVWAKVSGFVHWPAKVFDPASDLVPAYMREPPKPNYSLVRFLGTYDIQWASSRQIEPYESGLKKRLHTKSRSKLFAKALAEVKVFLEKGELPRDMEEKPPTPDSQEESEGEEEEGGEEEEEEKVSEKASKPPAKAGTKRKAASKAGSRGSRKVKVLETDETGNSSSAEKEKQDEENGEEKKT